jgi:hypothetical protein
MLAIANKAEETRSGATGGESGSGGGGEGEGVEDAEEGKESDGQVMAASCQSLSLSCLRAFVTKCSGQKGKPGAPMDAKV